MSTEERNAALSQAYRYARLGALGPARYFVRKAMQFAPLTEKQLYRLRAFFGPVTLEELSGAHHDALLRGLERRMGGKP